MSEVSRRDFVKTGATVITGIAVGWPFGAMAAGEAPLRVSIGYWNDDRLLHSRRARPAQSFLPAESVLSGDPHFFSAGGARFRIHGYTRPTPSPEAETVMLDVLYAVDGVDTKVPFFAFTSRSAGNATRRSLSFDAPVETTATLDMRVSRRLARDGSVATVAIPFAVNSAEGALKLNTGTYAFAVLRDSEQPPDWSRVRLVLSTSQEPRPTADLVEDTIAGPQPVGFDHLLFTVTYPKNS